jgi:dTDP-4-amino-4,6-dideoxygalactose transaminase
VVQLKKLDQFIDERAKWADYYSRELNAIEWLRVPSFSADYKHGWQSYVVFVDESKSPVSRNEIMEQLQELGISTRPGTHAVHMLNYYKELYSINATDYPGAMEAPGKTRHGGYQCYYGFAFSPGSLRCKTG